MAKLFLKTCLTLVILSGCSWASDCEKKHQTKDEQQVKSNKAEPNSPLDEVLKKLREKTENLNSYQASLDYLFRQPLLFDSKTLKKGVIYYARFGKKSKLRMNFNTLKQDEAKERPYKEQFIFDGVWLTHIDYQIRHLKRKQLVQPNEPVDAFELAKKNFPIVGFSEVQELKKQFYIKLEKPENNNDKHSLKLQLQAKPDSRFKDEYDTIECLIDKKTHLPAKITALTPEGDIYEITMLKPKVNKKIDQEIFTFTIPRGFTVEKIPLEKEPKQKSPDQ